MHLMEYSRSMSLTQTYPHITNPAFAIHGGPQKTEAKSKGNHGDNRYVNDN